MPITNSVDADQTAPTDDPHDYSSLVRFLKVGAKFENIVCWKFRRHFKG